MESPQDVIVSCLKDNYITAYRSGRVYSNRANKNLGATSTKGYLVCTLHYKGVRKQCKIHQIIWIAFKGPISNGLFVDHKNRDKKDNSLSNLRLVTPKQNSQNRRSYIGTKNPSARTCHEEACEIRRLNKLGLSYSDLANAFSISKSLVASIVRREVWN